MSPHTRNVLFHSMCCAVGAAALLALGCGGGGQTYPRAPGCPVEVLLVPPRDGYIELGEMSFDAYVGRQPRYQYKSPYQLLADAHGQICAIGGDTLVAERNALGVITHATVYRHATAYDVPTQPRPVQPKTEGCDGGCAAGSTCEQSVCVPACDRVCGPSETCGADRLCHGNETPGSGPNGSPDQRGPAADPAPPLNPS